MTILEMNLTEQWKVGKLEEYKKYYCRTEWFEDIFQARCYDKGTKGEWWALENAKYRYNNICHTKKDIEVLAPVPSYEELQEKQKSLKVLAEAYCKEKEENQQLKELLKECDNELKILRMLSLPMASKGALSECDDLLSKIDNAIGEKK